MSTVSSLRVGIVFYVALLLHFDIGAASSIPSSLTPTIQARTPDNFINCRYHRLPENFSRKPVNGVKPFPSFLGFWAWYTLRIEDRLQFLCSTIDSFGQPWHGYTVQCSCVGGKVVCHADAGNKAQTALYNRHHDDCIVWCDCPAASFSQPPPRPAPAVDRAPAPAPKPAPAPAPRLTTPFANPAPAEACLNEDPRYEITPILSDEDQPANQMPPDDFDTPIPPPPEPQDSAPGSLPELCRKPNKTNKSGKVRSWGFKNIVNKCKKFSCAAGF
ncbi:MAG: hypothetical protein M1833_006813 [Piccolia ochrophora]|nr:MAG: hypothetical protein M1833_006813 [Piccolia ochrophora]